ncbi:MAG: hypothetical protein IJZ13_02475 [Clostridia bacterium]|nr:hypothetical protein [Clostridia bacterium]
MSTARDNFPYTRFLMIGAFAQLAMAGILYFLFAVNKPVLIVLALIAALCLYLGGKVEHKAARVTVRTLFYTLPAATFLISLVNLIWTVVANEGSAEAWDYAVPFFFVSLTLLFNTVLLFAIPVFAVIAHFQRKRCDIFVLRLYAGLQLALALFTVLYTIDSNMLTLGIDNGYYNLFYCLVSAITALCALAAFPIKIGWMSRLFRGTTHSGVAEEPEEPAAEEVPEIPEEEREPIKPIFRD